MPSPLTPAECERIWRWERWTIRLCIAGTLAIAGAFGLGYLLGDEAMTRRLVIAVFVGLVIAGAIAPLRETCPRCRKRLTSMWRLSLPETCRRCGVTFPRPPA